MGMFVGDAIENLDRSICFAGEKQSMAVDIFGKMVEITLAQCGQWNLANQLQGQSLSAAPANTDAMNKSTTTT